ncbi:MAG: serine--tRNA ligase, partial [Parcubacteria group bacterium CG07_land_8_20_14_0_80_35_11]
MLDIKFIRQNPEKVKKGCRKKQVKVDITRVLIVDQEKRKYQKTLEELRAKQRRLSFETPLPLKKLTGIKNEIKK